MRIDKRRFLSLELTARGLPSDSPEQNMEGWFASAHEWIVNGFGDLTTQEAQTVLWQKYE